MKTTAAILLGLLLVVGLTQPAAAKDAGELLEQYLNDPAVASQEELALVEVTAVNVDPKPEGNWKQTGTLELRKIESTGPKLPDTFTVRFYVRGAGGGDQWTWDDVQLNKGGRLLGFFNQWSGQWAVRGDGRTHVISNVERLDKKVLARAQKLFKTPLVAKPATTQASPATAPSGRTPPPYTDEQAVGFAAGRSVSDDYRGWR